MRPFVVTGCGRSGTYYTAELLRRLGLLCQHEGVFSPTTTGFEGFGDAHGDSSWLAAPYLDQLPPGSVVLHQVRSPAAVARSFTDLSFFAEPGSLRSWAEVATARGKWWVRRRLEAQGHVPARPGGPRPRSYFVQFLRRHAPEVFDEVGELDRALRYWVVWNELVERQAAAGGARYVRFQVEDLGPSRLRELVAEIGLDVPQELAQLVSATTPRSLNAAPTRRAQAEPRDTPARRAAARLGQRYGYDIAAWDRNQDRVRR